MAREAISGIQGRRETELALVRVATALAKQGRFNEATSVFESIKGPSSRAEAAVQIATEHAAHGDIQAVRLLLENAKSLTPSDNHTHNAAAKQILAAYLQSPRPELAEAFSREINDPATLSEAYQAIASANRRKGKISDAKRMFEKSRQVAENVADSYAKCLRLRELATAQFAAGDRGGALTAIELAVAAARSIELGGGTDVIALTETATTQITIGDRDGAAASFELARTTAARYADEAYVAGLLHDVALAQARVGEVETAIQSARRQKSAFIRARMLLAVANAMLSRWKTKP